MIDSLFNQRNPQGFPHPFPIPHSPFKKPFLPPLPNYGIIITNQSTMPIQAGGRSAEMFGKKFQLDDQNLRAIEEIGKHMPGGFFIYRAQPPEEILYANHAVYDIFGCPDQAAFKALTGNTFVMPHTDVTVTATFREKEMFKVIAQAYDSSTDNGQVFIGDWRPDEFYYEGSTVTAIARPDTGLTAVSWTVLMQDELSGEYIYAVPGVSHPTPNTISFTMPSADVLVSATFSESHDQRLVFINDMEGGTVEPDKTLVGPQDDELVTLTILPGNGYRYVPDSLRLMDADRDNGSQLDITPISIFEICQYILPKKFGKISKNLKLAYST